LVQQSICRKSKEQAVAGGPARAVIAKAMDAAAFLFLAAARTRSI